MMGLWSRGAHVHPVSRPRPRDSMIPVKRAPASSRREAQPERCLAYTSSAQLAREIQRPHDTDLAPSALPRPQGTRSGHVSGQRRRREEEKHSLPICIHNNPTISGEGIEKLERRRANPRRGSSTSERGRPSSNKHQGFNGGRQTQQWCGVGLSPSLKPR